MTVLAILLIIIFSPLIIIAGFISIALLWAILDLIVTSIITEITNISKNISNSVDKKE